jgi:hypothetical protein
MKYLGTKLIKAEPMNKYEFFMNIKGVDCHEENEPGYLVVYSDGYKSWSPKDVFEEAYRPADGMTFGLATEVMKKGRKVARKGWNGKGQWVVLMPSLYLPPYSTQAPGAKVNDRTAKHIGVDTPLDSQPYFALWNAQGKWQPGWVPSTSDCLADDWHIVE